MEHRVLIVSPEMPHAPVGPSLRYNKLVRAASSIFTCDLVALTSGKLLTDVSAQDRARTALSLRRLVTVEHPQTSKVLRAIAGLATFRPLGQLLYDSRELCRVLKKLTSEEHYDACLILGGNCMAQYAKYVTATRIIWDMCDDEALTYQRRAAVARGFLRSFYYRLEAKIIESHVRKVCPMFDSILVIAEKDAFSLRQHYCKPIIAVPNSVDLDLFQPSLRHKNGNGHNLLFTGWMSYYPNRDAVRFFIDDVLPLIVQDCSAAEFHIVGNAADSLEFHQRSNVVRTGFVADMAPYYHSCDVFVCPLRTGTGIKNKVLEAMACGCAIVTTAIGAEGLCVANGRELLIAETPAEFAFAVQRLLKDPGLREVLGINARRFIEGEFLSAKMEEGLSCALAG